jgi:hypothetical protein
MARIKRYSNKERGRFKMGLPRGWKHAGVIAAIVLIVGCGGSSSGTCAGASGHGAETAPAPSVAQAAREFVVGVDAPIA